MARARGWAWEHIWLAFSLSGMILGNWILASLSFANPFAIYATVPSRELIVLCCFGLSWGVGAVLFGLGMDLIGLSLGYPLIMGLNASVGTFVPLLLLHGSSMFTGRRLLIVAGTGIAIAGIGVCSVAGARREPRGINVPNFPRSRLLRGLIIAIASGILSCLPNIGITLGVSTVKAALDRGSAPASAGNAVWFVFFTCGGIVNVLYCLCLMVCRRNLAVLFARGRRANWLLAVAMGAMWISSFYLYGFGVARLGLGGATIGWPILISLSIGIGVLGGLGRGEWKGTAPAAKSLLLRGLALLILALLIIPWGINS